MATLVNFTKIEDDRKTGAQNNPRPVAVNPEYVVSVNYWTETTTELRLHIGGTIDRVFVVGGFNFVVDRLNGGN